jgi:hypothetical protein
MANAKDSTVLPQLETLETTNHGAGNAAATQAG